VFVAAGTILYVSTNFYTADVCAVAADGSLWCFGPNSNGELGTGNTDPVTVATQVQPPGSVFTACR
jgi:alpha-tubulin suppressor-like RCC1 family protein